MIPGPVVSLKTSHADEAVGRTGGPGGKGANGRADGGGLGVDSRADRQMGPTRRGHRDGQKRRGRGPRGADGRTGGLVDGRMGGLGGRGRKSRGRADGESGGRADGRTGGRADERVGLGLKGHIPRSPLHSWAPSPLASSERECAGCLGMQWGPVRFHVKHPYLAPRLTCLV